MQNMTTTTMRQGEEEEGEEEEESRRIRGLVDLVIVSAMWRKC